MKNRIIIAFSIIVLLMLSPDAFSQRGRISRPAGPPQSAPYTAIQPGQPGQGRHLQYMKQMGQRRPGENCLNMEGLTEDQKAALRKLHVARMEKSIQHRSQMEVLQARKRSAMIMKDTNINEVNKIIDEMGALSTAWMKEAVAHREEIRKLLTDEQRVLFDSRSARAPMMRGRR
jgi:Spy/CpxP family protein refolding chaperone